MALVKDTLQLNIYNGLYQIFKNQADKATNGDENEDPQAVINQIANDIAATIADAVDSYIKSGDVIVGPSNITVTSPAGACTVVPATPAKIT